MEIDEKTETGRGIVDQMLDIMDNEPIDLNDGETCVSGVVVRVPTIYVNTDENGIDQSIENLRLIDETSLTDIMTIALDIGSASHDRSIEIWKTLVSMLVKRDSSSSETNVLSFLNYISEMGKDLDVDDDYVNIDARWINFDVQRVYTNDPNSKILTSHEILPNSPLYSQLGDGVTDARKRNNDTRLNRVYLFMEHLEKVLRFERGYVLDKTIKMANVALTFLCVVAYSRPIRFLSSNDLKANILSYIIDLVVRSRVIQAWQNDESSRLLLADLTKNYDSRHIMVNLCKLRNARERAKYVLRQFSEIERVRDLVRCLSYEEYERLLRAAIVNVNDHEYFLFDNRFLASVAALQSFAAMRKLYQESPNDENRVWLRDIIGASGDTRHKHDG